MPLPLTNELMCLGHAEAAFYVENLLYRQDELIELRLLMLVLRSVVVGPARSI